MYYKLTGAQVVGVAECPRCGATVGYQCINRTKPGEPLVAPHTSRIELACSKLDEFIDTLPLPTEMLPPPIPVVDVTSLARENYRGICDQLERQGYAAICTTWGDESGRPKNKDRGEWIAKFPPKVALYCQAPRFEVDMSHTHLACVTLRAHVSVFSVMEAVVFREGGTTRPLVFERRSDGAMLERSYLFRRDGASYTWVKEFSKGRVGVRTKECAVDVNGPNGCWVGRSPLVVPRDLLPPLDAAGAANLVCSVVELGE